MDFQWYGPEGLMDGEITNILQLQEITVEDAGDYYAIITNACAEIYSDYATLTIQQNPTAFAGDDATICQDEVHGLYSAEASHYQSLLWETTGTGTFDDPEIINPVYSPSAEDAIAGEVTISLTAYAINPCFTNTVSSLVLTIWLLPEFDLQPENITVQTGEDAVFTVEVSGTEPINLQWYGPEGIIDGATATELTIQKVNFLSVGDFYCVAENVCEPVWSQVASLNVISGGVSQSISLSQGWSGVSSYLWMDNFTVEEVFAPYFAELIIMMDDENMFWPGMGVNTIGLWDNHQGYKIKVDEAFELILSGSLENETTLELASGWTIIPVLSECTVDVEEIFAPLSGNMVIVKDVAGWNVYWPEFGINTLQTLEPGRAYFVLMDSEAELTFPECVLKITPSLTLPIEEKGVSMHKGNPVLLQKKWTMDEANFPWKITPPSTTSHTIAIPITATQNSGIGDNAIIGAFSSNGICHGLTILEKDKNTVLTIFGNDPYTKIKDGFDENDPIILKSYNQETKAEHILEAGFDANYTGNTFINHGLSVIRNLKTGFISEAEQGINSISIFPNPAMNKIYISGFDGEATITILDNRGRAIINNLCINPNEAIDISTLRQGVYFVEVSTNVEKIIERLVKME